MCSEIRAETAFFHQFPPQIIIISAKFLLCHRIIQTLVVLGSIVDVAVVVDGGESCNIIKQKNSRALAVRELMFIWVQILLLKFDALDDVFHSLVVQRVAVNRDVPHTAFLKRSDKVLR